MLKSLLGIVFVLTLSVASFSQSKFERLPSDFEPDDLGKVYQVLNKMKKEKGEFETTAEYEKRISTISEVKIIGDKTTKDFFYFYFEPTRLMKSKYDADKQSYQLEHTAIELSTGGKSYKTITAANPFSIANLYRADHIALSILSVFPQY